MQFSCQTFSDAGDHAAVLDGWDQRYFQLGSGKFESSMWQLSLDALHVFYETANQRVTQQVTPPKDTIAFGLPLGETAPYTFAGRALAVNSLIVARGSREFVMHSPENMQLIGVELSLDAFSRLASRCQGKRCIDQPNGPPILSIPVDRLRRVGIRLLQLLRAIESEPQILSNDRAEARIEQQIVDAISELLDDEMLGVRADFTQLCHSEIVERTRQLVLQSGDEPITVQQLCEQLKVSRRTIQNSFQTVTGLTPVEYMRSIRLNLVRNLLRKTHPNELTVRDAAQLWGFLHLGHFAHDYRYQFGESPSDTRLNAVHA
ncbi:MAG TPA: helix-turn-helix domain-containing protein [Paraburkholderia sp.]|nr:helix-turn-helix domain-containing protein [Paraburkholderia sp.]